MPTEACPTLPRSGPSTSSHRAAMTLLEEAAEDFHSTGKKTMWDSLKEIKKRLRGFSISKMSRGVRYGVCFVFRYSY